MKALKRTAQVELLNFLSEFNLAEILKHQQLKDRIVRTFRFYYPLLLLENELSVHPQWPQKSKVEQFQLYLREAISDICQAIVLTASGFYKPAQLTLRSGLENWLRCLGLAEDQVVLTLKSVFELIELVKSIPAISDNKFAKEYFSTLRNRYALLCGFVHTSNASHMALTTVAGAYPRYLKTEAAETFSAIDEVCSRMVYLFCIIAPKTFRGLHHSHFDIVSDALPKKLKAGWTK